MYNDPMQTTRKAQCAAPQHQRVSAKQAEIERLHQFFTPSFSEKMDEAKLFDWLELGHGISPSPDKTRVLGRRDVSVQTDEPEGGSPIKKMVGSAVKNSTPIEKKNVVVREKMNTIGTEYVLPHELTYRVNENTSVGPQANCCSARPPTQGMGKPMITPVLKQPKTILSKNPSYGHWRGTGVIHEIE